MTWFTAIRTRGVPLVALACLAVLLLLPRIKGGFLGLLWANRVNKDQVA